ncbi:MAG TPA: glucose-6-phosphate dehydrogenase [Roseiarcus sp.]|nr:glucose-6-phosphate dehydrogenase [Roseiarcus sp.]
MTPNGKAKSDALVVFGATGDLAYKQIFPALYGLARDEGLRAPIIGVAKQGWTLDQLKERALASIREHVKSPDAAALAQLSNQLRYVDGDYKDAATFAALRRELTGIKRPLHYLAIPPSLFATVAAQLSASDCAADARLVIEKPFGRDRETARKLGEVLAKHFPEEDIFRIDHYLGKEPVQNITYTRFANPLFEPIWNRDHVHCIQITMAESFGVEDRGRFYDETGAIRDVLQNHMLQVLAILTMDPPSGEDHDAQRDQKVNLLKAVRPLAPADVVRGQYLGYQDVPGVRPGSTVETYVAVRLAINDWRWAGVPILIRTGKALPVTTAEVMVEFKRPPRETFGEIVPTASAHLRFRLSPDVTIGMGVRVKSAGESMAGQDVELLLTRQPGGDRPPYQRLLGDAMNGIEDLFTRQDLIDAQWRIVDQVLDDATPLYPYPKGAWGPKEAEKLVEDAGGWRDPWAPEKT